MGRICRAVEKRTFNSVIIRCCGSGLDPDLSAKTQRVDDQIVVTRKIKITIDEFIIGYDLIVITNYHLTADCKIRTHKAGYANAGTVFGGSVLFNETAYHISAVKVPKVYASSAVGRIVVDYFTARDRNYLLFIGALDVKTAAVFHCFIVIYDNV